MPVRDILFTQGQSEAIDPKILPDGLLSSAQNVRIKKDGRIGSRFGYDLTTTLVSTPFMAAGNFGSKRSIYIKERTSISQPPQVVDRRDNGSYFWAGQNALALYPTAPPSQIFGVSTLGAPVRKPVGRNLQYACTSCDTAFISDRIFCVYDDFDYATNSSRGLFLAVYNAYSHSKMYAGLIDANGRNPKLVAGEGLGGNIFIVYNDGTTNIKYVAINTISFGTALAGTIAIGARGFSFDAIALSSSQFLLAYESAAGSALEWGTVDRATVVYTQRRTLGTTTYVYPCLALGSSGNVVMAWCEGGDAWAGNNVKYRVDTTAGVQVTATTTISAAGNAQGFPVVGTNTADDFSIAWNFIDNTKVGYAPGSVGTFTPRIGAVKNLAWSTVVSRPFMRSSVFTTDVGCYIWVVNRTTQNTDLAEAATYRLVDIESVQNTTAFAQGALCEAIACKKEAMPGAYIISGVLRQDHYDIRRSSPAVTTVLGVPSSSANATLLPVSISSITNADGIIQRFGCDLVRFDTSPWADRLLPANINGQLFFSGPRVYEFDGTSFHESGLGDGPEYVRVTDAGAGSMAAGIYQYILVHNWVDAIGRRHQSAPSTIRTIAIAASHNVAVEYVGPAHSAKFAAGTQGYAPGVTTNIYRTLAGGSTFFLVNAGKNLIANTNTYDNTFFTYTDSATDASISVNEKLYTQGTRGGLSGNLQNDCPPPCKFLWPGNNRLIAGGLEIPNVVQWSKLVFPGEPLAFSDNPAFKATVDGDVTGVASLDGIWYVGTQNAIYAFSGEGPDDNLSGGDFGDPRKLPSDIGFYSQRSIVEIQEGLLFQGAADRIYLLPRGGGAPEWVGQPVRDTLATYPVVADAQLNVSENLVYFACLNTSPSAGVLLVYDTRVKQWYVDIPFNGADPFNAVFRCLDVYDGKLMLDGHYTETAAYVDDETGVQNRAIVPQLITGDIRPFGPLGHGRVRKMTLLGEARDITTLFSPTINVSYDSGKTYADPGTWTIANLASAIGDAIEAEHMLLYPKNDAYRVKLSWTAPSPTEGITWTGLSLENNPEQGVHRQPNARRG